jgi:protocatechuate 3,4-dioxygenase beta subunit
MTKSDHTASTEYPAGRRRIGALLLALALLASACGGSDAATGSDPEADEPVPTTVAGGPEAAEPAPASDDVDLIAECEPFPSFSEGSFYLDAGVGGELAADLPGTSGIDLAVRIVIVDAEDCRPLRERDVQIWSAGPDGRYSGVDRQPDGAGDATIDERWLRGHQVTDANGQVEFATVIPGWIPGQAPHLHVTVPFDDDRAFTARLVLPDEVTTAVYGEAGYADRGAADVTAAIELERDPGVQRSIIEVTPAGDGYEANIVLAIAEAELREPPLAPVPMSVSPSEDSGALVDEPVRNFDQIGGELQEMFTQAASDLGVEPERLYGAFRFVTSESPPDLPAIAEDLGVTEEALALALPLLAGGAPLPAGE